ncbi:methyl-accepting chemotaxis protein [Gallaecimonas xiamenensis]|uniref:Methyl-accepting chemotaxis sensory transducer n=1 Tax=Gallaecimonas xiamenensis 3-C-1 TaxID=745411 RepID=K2KHI1_9GAMM|nr:methyl-accepting chemotaxis protein [Gallaecimonas xiamenensis]EKE76725.1 methyl-accepting chemotaxis sensory transducer [Gallaecimonas xiamenensis 3-C-1]
MQHWSLRSKILTVTGLCFLLFFVAVLWQSLSALKQNINRMLEEEVGLFASAFSSSVGDWMQDRRQAMTKLAKSIADHPEVPSYLFLDQTKDGLGFSLTYLGTPAGDMIRNDPSIKNKDGYDPRQRSWYQGATQARGSFLTAPFVSATNNQYVVTLAEPVWRDGDIAGVVGGNLTLDQLTAHVNALKIPGKGYAVLVDKSDQVIAHPETSRQSKKASAITSEFTGAGLEALIKTRHLNERRLDGRDRFIFAEAIPNTSWALILVMDKDTLMAPVQRQLYTQLGISLVILVLVLAVLSWLMKILLKHLSEITRNLDAIANGNGDLTIRLAVHSQDEIGRLAGSFNRFVEQLHGIISRLREASQGLLKEAEQTAVGAQQQDQRIQRHQSEIHMVATAVTEMASATQEISTNAEQTAFSARSCVGLTEEGRRQVEQSQKSIENLAGEVARANGIIGELNHHAQNINSILATISGIAEQTNLLALNAAIEAARAGDQGRGFAVVADEVRVLSQRTHSSTQEIQGMIESLQRSASQAVDATDQGSLMAERSVADAELANQSLGAILDAINQINDMSAQIASAAEEQSSVTLEINRNTETIRGVGDEMSSSSRQAASQAGKLQQLGQQVASEVGKFKL